MSSVDELKRAALLIEMDRFEQAEKELANFLARHPDSAAGHQLLAESHLQRDQEKQAEIAAKEAIRCDPTDYFGYLTLARTLCGQKDRRADAEEATRQALELGPYDPTCHAVQAVLHINRRNWEKAVESCEVGLELDPEHAGCLHMHAHALHRSGRLEDARAVLNYSLSKNPLNEGAHEQLGWTCLAKGDAKGASFHFQEALRIAPNSDTAKQGMIEAIKARNVVYRQWFSFLLWLSRFSGRVQLIAFVILVFGLSRFQAFLDQGPPRFQWIGLAVGAAYMLFVFLIWTSGPLTNMLLRVHPMGKHLLTAKQKWATLACLAYLLAAAGMTTFWLFLGVTAGVPTSRLAEFVFLGMVYAMLLIPVSSAFQSEAPRNRNIAILASVALTIAAYPLTIFAILTANRELLVRSSQIVIYGLVAFTWLRAFIGAVEE